MLLKRRRRRLLLLHFGIAIRMKPATHFQLLLGREAGVVEEAEVGRLGLHAGVEFDQAVMAAAVDADHAAVDAVVAQGAAVANIWPREVRDATRA